MIRQTYLAVIGIALCMATGCQKETGADILPDRTVRIETRAVAADGTEMELRDYKILFFTENSAWNQNFGSGKTIELSEETKSISVVAQKGEGKIDYITPSEDKDNNFIQCQKEEGTGNAMPLPAVFFCKTDIEGSPSYLALNLECQTATIRFRITSANVDELVFTLQGMPIGIKAVDGSLMTEIIALPIPLTKNEDGLFTGTANCFPTQDAEFKYTYNGAESTVSCGNIEAGKSYTFHLAVHGKLTLTSVTVTDQVWGEGWNNETDL